MAKQPFQKHPRDGGAIQAGYQCQNLRLCGHIWAQPKPASVDCPRCGYRYVKWLNYESHFEGKK